MGVGRGTNSAVNGNLLLDQLDRTDRERLARHLVPVAVAGGSDLSTVIAPDAVAFPLTLVAAVGEHLDGVGAVQTGLIGREGMIGWQAGLGAAQIAHAGAALLGGGTVLTMPIAALRDACDGGVTLQGALLRYAHSFTVQLGRTIVANLRDGVDQRLSRWLLMLHDRVGGDELALTHVELASALAVRRASVTDALHILEGDRVVRCTRGRLVIRDRAGLRARAGDGYGAAERHYAAQIAPFGKG